MSWASLQTSPWLSLQGSGPREAAQLPRAEDTLCWTPAAPPKTSDHHARRQRWEQSSLQPGQTDLLVHLSGEQAVRWALNCPGDGRRTLLLGVDCCPEGDAELTLGVLHCLTHHVKTHAALLPLLDTIRRRHWHLCKGQSFFLGWEFSAPVCSSFPAQLVPGNRLSPEALVHKRCTSWGEGTTPTYPKICQFGSHEPRPERKKTCSLSLCIVISL